jgi:hypothetical protein
MHLLRSKIIQIKYSIKGLSLRRGTFFLVQNAKYMVLDCRFVGLCLGPFVFTLPCNW